MDFDLLEDSIRYYKRYNLVIFKSKLPKYRTKKDPKYDKRRITIRINPRLQTTSGRTLIKTRTYIRVGEIELNPTLLNTTDKLKNTLVHEMCHLAMWIIDGKYRPAHGDLFYSYANKSMKKVPSLKITTTHNYEIEKKYEYECKDCNKSLKRLRRVNVTKFKCGKCGGKLKEKELKIL